jgi:branched-chain amino acid transport system permease protein
MGSPPTPSISSRPASGGLSILVTLPAAVLAAGLAALLVGSLSLRTKGFFFLMVTLAFGTDGVLPLPRHQARRRHRRRIPQPPDALVPGLAAAAHSASAADGDLLRGARAYWSPCTSGSSSCCARCSGRVLEGIRVNEHRMQALGFNTYRYKLAAFVVAGALAGRGRTHVGHAPRLREP